MNALAPLPEPLTPPECDLTDFPFTSIYRAKLFGSVFHAKANDSEWRAGVTLWLKSQDQRPAGSLPDDDVDLCRLAELGRDLKTWRKLRERALHGWNRHSDGRLYHRTVAIEALIAWIEKLLQRKSSAAGNAKRWGAGFDTATLDASLRNAIGMLTALDPQSRTLQKRGVKLAFSNPDDRENTQSGIPVGQNNDPGGIAEPGENRPKGQGQGQGQGKEEKHMSDKSDLCVELDGPKARKKPARAGYARDFEEFWKAYPTDKLMSKAKAGAHWLKLSPEDRALALAAIPGFRDYCSKNKTYRPVHAVRFLSEGRFEGFAVQPIDFAKAAAAKEKADQFLRRGKYAEAAQ